MQATSAVILLALAFLGLASGAEDTHQHGYSERSSLSRRSPGRRALQSQGDLSVVAELEAVPGALQAPGSLKPTEPALFGVGTFLSPADTGTVAVEPPSHPPPILRGSGAPASELQAADATPLTTRQAAAPVVNSIKAAAAGPKAKLMVRRPMTRRPPRPPPKPPAPPLPPDQPGPPEENNASPPSPPSVPPPDAPDRPEPPQRRQASPPRPGGAAQALVDGWWITGVTEGGSVNDGGSSGGADASPPPPPSPRPPIPRRLMSGGGLGIGVERGEVGSPPVITRPPPPSPRPSPPPPPPPPSPPSPPPTPPPPPRAPRPPPAPSLIDIQIILDAHNAARALAGVRPLSWDAGLAASAQSWSTQCTWQHSSGSYGENLASGAYRTTKDPLNGIGIWYNEVCDYDFSKPSFSTVTGHYTQMVWADTRTVGCGYTACPDGVMGLGANTGVLVCQYWPPGNLDSASEFRDNVLQPRTFPDRCPAGYGSSTGR